MKKILVMGKEPKVCADIRKYFDPQKYRLLCSHDPEDGVASAIRLKPDLIILDLDLLHLCGVDILNELKEANSSLPIITIADSSSNIENMEMIKERVYGHIKRPIRQERLLFMVKEAVSTSTSRVIHSPATMRGEQKELKGVSKLSGLIVGAEKGGADCKRPREGYSPGKKDYDRVFDQVLTPIYDQIMVNSKGNIYDHLISGLEKSLISLALRYCNHNQVKASQILGISRNTLRERIKRYDLW